MFPRSGGWLAQQKRDAAMGAGILGMHRRDVDRLPSRIALDHAAVQEIAYGGGAGSVDHCENELAKISPAMSSVTIGGTCQRNGRR